MARIVLGIEYDGSAFSGWQFQPGKRTVQESVQRALSGIANEPIVVHCAGRTDAGVHALEQVVHFDTGAQRALSSWVFGTNVNLPDDVKVLWAQYAVDDFHARFSAIARYYRYVILNRPTRSALLRTQVTWFYPLLDADLMHYAAQALIGEHDFTSFRAQGCQSQSPKRLMHFIHVFRQGEQVIIELSANAFLHHMVRNIAGVLMAIGSGKRSPDWTTELLVVRDRTQAGVTASPCGLYLGGVFYPEHYGLKKQAVFDVLPADVRRFDG